MEKNEKEGSGTTERASSSTERAGNGPEGARISPEKAINNTNDKLNISSLFTNKKEITLACELQKLYLSEYNIETVSDKEILRQLIYLEIFHRRLQNTANDLQKETDTVPLQLIEGLHKNLSQIVTLKEKLGLTKAQRETSNSGFEIIQALKKKFKIWLEQNQGSRTLACPHCSKLIMLKIRTDKWRASKHPFFEDRILTNKHLLFMIDSGQITKKDAALVLETSEDYISWILEKRKPPKTGLNLALNTEVIPAYTPEGDLAMAVPPDANKGHPG